MTTMNCKRAQRTLPASLDSELAGPEQDRLNAHLAQCPACRAEAEARREEMALLRELPPVEVSPFLLTRVMADVRQTRPTSRLLLVFGRALSAAAVMVLVALCTGVGTMLGSGLASHTQKPPASILTFEESDTLAPDVYSYLGGE